MNRLRMITALAGLMCCMAVGGEAEDVEAEREQGKIAMLSADALRAGTLAYPRFEDHVRRGVSEAGELGKHLSNPSNYVVEIDDRGDHFSIAFIDVAFPEVEERRGGGWQCVVERDGWRVVGCNRMK